MSLPIFFCFTKISATIIECIQGIRKFFCVFSELKNFPLNVVRKILIAVCKIISTIYLYGKKYSVQVYKRNYDMSTKRLFNMFYCHNRVFDEQIISTHFEINF